MMPQFDDTNRGILFREKQKKSDKAPDYTGKIDVEGKPYRMAAWIREGKQGKFFSLAISEPEKRGQAPDPLDDDIPIF